MTKAELVAKLLAITPHPPVGNDEALLEGAVTLLAAREAVLANLVVAGGAPANHEAVDELLARQTAWDTALADARDRVGGHRVGASRLRRYAGR